MNRVVPAPRPILYGLTPREFEIIREICDGASNGDIAKKLVISDETVKRHLSNIFDKTGVSTRLELALFAITKGLVSLDAAGRLDSSRIDLKTFSEYIAGIQRQLAVIQNLLGLTPQI